MVGAYVTSVALEKLESLELSLDWQLFQIEPVTVVLFILEQQIQLN